MNRSDLHPDIQKALAELSKAIHELDNRWLQDPSNAEQTETLRFLRNQCCLYYDNLLGNDLTEEEKLKLCHEIVKF